MERKYVYVLIITDGCKKFMSAYSDFIIAQKHMYRDIYNTITDYNMDECVPVSNTQNKVEFCGFRWEIVKCEFTDRIDF